MNPIPMKIVVIIYLAALTLSSTPFRNDQKVYYCDSPTAKRYHMSKTCKGLENCTHEIREVSVSEAEQLKLTSCKLEK